MPERERVSLTPGEEGNTTGQSFKYYCLKVYKWWTGSPVYWEYIISQLTSKIKYISAQFMF